MITQTTILSLIDTFCNHWDRLKNPVDSIEKRSLMKLLATNVKELCKAFSKSSYRQKFLFEYFLNTVWGAPFVFEISLNEASHNLHDFKTLMHHMLEHSRIIDTELAVAKEQIIHSFSKKKSA